MFCTEKEKVLVLVKTYPTISAKYVETVCTAGITETGEWRRLYPIPFRGMEAGEQYKKYQWITCSTYKTKSDPRLESRHIEGEIHPAEFVGCENKWETRRRLILDRLPVSRNLSDAIHAAKTANVSLILFKPRQILDFVCERNDTPVDEKRFESAKQKLKELSLYEQNDWQQTFNFSQMVPYKFSYSFCDDVGKTSKLQILDWETGALFWNCLNAPGGNEEKACKMVRDKYMPFADTKRYDTYFYLGTTRQHHYRALNPWQIIGVAPFPAITHRQPELELG